MARVNSFERSATRRRRRSTRLVGVIGLAAMLVIAIGAMILNEAPALAPAPPAATDETPATGAIYALDGDTLDIAGKRIRLADIDAPELFSPKCDTERSLARKAKNRL